MQINGQKIVEAARQYLGVRYQNQGRSKEDGLDCGGLILVVARDLGLSELEFLGYSNQPDGETFEKLLDANCFEIEQENIQPGDIVACNYGKGIQHIAFITEIQPRLKVIHAKRPRNGFGSNDRGVIETYLHGNDLRSWVASYRIKGVDIE